MKKEVVCAFILSSVIIMSIASSLYGPGTGQYSFTPQSIPYLGLASPADSDLPESQVSQIPTIVPSDNPGEELPDTDVILSGSGTQPVTKSISSYVTIEARESPEIESHTLLRPTIPDPERYGAGYVTIYTLTGQNVSQSSPLVSFSLLNPPLVIDYSIEPLKVAEIKYMEYKELSTMHQESHIIARPYEDAWFKVIVRNKDTGQIVAEDGVGRTYSLQSPKQLVVRENGNYTFEFTGVHAKLDLTMKVKEEGNFP
jgi:hypothetical protein